MDEKIELTLTSRLSDTTSIASSVRTLETMDSRTSLFGHNCGVQFSQHAGDPNVSKQCKKTMLTLVQILVTTLSIAAILLSVVAIIYYFNAIHRQDDDMNNLKQRIFMLEQMIMINMSRENQTQVEEYNIKSEYVYELNVNIESINNSISSLNQTLINDRINFGNRISEMYMYLLQYFADTIQQLNATIGDNLGRITAINDRIFILDNHMHQVQDSNKTVNLYHNCTVDREMCTGAQLSNLYWRVCATPSLPLNVTVSYYTRQYTFKLTLF